jgi:dienelactone hydrolase
MASWGKQTNLTQEVYYAGEPFQGKPTRIFAYYARPAHGSGPFPAVLLVHGGGGKAFREWAEHWARRGYVALAMDLAGNGPGGRLPDGGPNQDDATKFRDFSDAEANEMWTYHAVAAVIRGHSLLAAQKEVDRNRIGITGISWGGYLTCIVAGLDDRLKVAVPVYGCGFLHENSAWLARFEKMSAAQKQRWVDYFDPSKYLAGVRCPILFLNGSNDFAYPLDSYQKSYREVSGPMTLSVKVRLLHGHIWTFGEVDCFVDSVLKNGEPLPRLKPMIITEGAATTTFTSKVPVKKAELNYTSDVGEWQKRLWKTVPAEMINGKVTANLPLDRPLVCYLSITDQRNITVSTLHVEISDRRGK